MADKKTAVVLFNLGGPLKKDDIQPFLFNLFNDPAIIGLPGVIRTPLAWLISKRRVKAANEIYAHLNGGSPLLEKTQKQADLLQQQLPSENYKVFIAMRYWHPMTQSCFQAVKKWGPDELVLLPLYPQFSTTTTGSSIKEWYKYAKETWPTKEICCYPTSGEFVLAQTELLQQVLLNNNLKKQNTRILFSAHGLPQKIVDAGDPYQWQVENTVSQVRDKLGLAWDSVVCYQSKVGPLKWLTPSLDQELKRAKQDGKGVVIVPISFVSEHSETLVELDIEYKEVAEDLELPFYYRVATVSEHPEFIKGLAALVSSDSNSGTICPTNYSNCWCRNKNVCRRTV